MSGPVKACVDCRYCSSPNFTGYTCLNERSAKPHMVHGLVFSGAKAAREDESLCGKAALYFEQRRISEGASTALFLGGVPLVLVSCVFVLLYVF